MYICTLIRTVGIIQTPTSSTTAVRGWYIGTYCLFFTPHVLWCYLSGEQTYMYKKMSPSPQKSTQPNSGLQIHISEETLVVMFIDGRLIVFQIESLGDLLCKRAVETSILGRYVTPSPSRITHLDLSLNQDSERAHVKTPESSVVINLMIDLLLQTTPRTSRLKCGTKQGARPSRRTGDARNWYSPGDGAARRWRPWRS
ncbi:hypothetical protein GGR54DRAFT_541568 [Hypoxylon sp. NC1633]|nr:hypothetical protein GGR54DRAFT_541568 [Hypoxylon sp. NC1633]